MCGFAMHDHIYCYRLIQLWPICISAIHVRVYQCCWRYHQVFWNRRNFFFPGAFRALYHCIRNFTFFHHVVLRILLNLANEWQTIQFQKGKHLEVSILACVRGSNIDRSNNTISQRIAIYGLNISNVCNYHRKWVRAYFKIITTQGET